jgi:aspartate/methionine/tyrosine aminotransferase
MRDFLPFVMERWQSTYENVVDFNLSESGVHPLSLEEFFELAGDAARSVRIGYGQSNGSTRLRENIAHLYDGIDPGHICVTNGSAEANFAVMWTLVKPGDTIAVLTPTYMQTPGLARGMGARIIEVPLHENRGWQPDPAEIEDRITGDVRLIVVTNPGNPTAVVLGDAARRSIVSAAERTGAWLLADEVYTGAEQNGRETASFFGEFDRVISTGSLSKAYGLPGLRVGWATAPLEIADALWARKDYTTISPGELTDHLAAVALSPEVRPKLLERTRGYILAGWERTDAWLREQGCFSCVPPDAGAICFARYDLPIDSADLAERLRVEKSLLIVPGSHFELGPYVRIGFGIEEEMLRGALGRFAELLEEVAAQV